MLDSILTEATPTLQTFLLCTAVSLALGLASAALCMYKNRYTQSFVVTLAILPAIVQLIIMLVNGNIGAGVAVAGAFSLVRFRSAAGSAREIGMIFLDMAIGLAVGMGYLLLAVLFFLIMAIFSMILSVTRFGSGQEGTRDLKITIPETLDYEGLFDDILQKYTTSAELMQVKTTSMGTLYELHYKITLKGNGIPKEFLDALRCRNGNLNIVCGRPVSKDAL